MAARSDLPKFDQLMIPTLEAIKSLGGSASNEELFEAVADRMRLPEQVRAFENDNGTSELAYRMRWARSYLKGYGAINNSERGVWSITEKGERLDEGNVVEIKRAVRSVGVKRREEERSANDPSLDGSETEVEAAAAVGVELSWQNELLEKIGKIRPEAFERLCQRVLRESGFSRVEVKGRSGDGGIDGTGVLRINLVSFHVLFQSKRWKNAVGSPEVRDFRGAMQGRADKGLIITTGTFTAEARREATRDGAPAIDLVDGESLCGLLKDLKLGVDIRHIEQVSVNETFFAEI